MRLYKKRLDEFGNPVSDDEEGETRDIVAETGVPLSPKDPKRGYTNNELRRAYNMRESPNEEDYSGKKNKNDDIISYLADLFMS